MIAMPLYAYTGKILFIDLTNEKHWVEELPEEVIKKFFGGRGLIAWYMWYKTEKGLNPLSPDAPFIVAAGPINATPIPASRSCVGGKSPHTGMITYSRMGAFSPISDELKKAGYDMMVITGKASKLSYIYVKDGTVEIRNAESLRGYGAYKTIMKIKEEVDEYSGLLVTGPAGENLVSISCAFGGIGDTAGRHGIGAMMGSKNLKAIAVRGTGEVSVADPEAVKKLYNDLLKLEMTAPGQNIRWGTTYWTYAASHGFSDNACFNYREGTNDEISFALSGYQYERKGYWVRQAVACYKCPLHCKKYGRVLGGKYTCIFEGPDYELNVLIGVNIGVSDVEGHLYLTWLVDDLSIDAISFGNTVGFLIECLKKGYLSSDDLGGVSIDWGDVDTFVKLAVWTAYKKGPMTVFGESLGELISKGVRYIAKRIEEIKGISDVWRITYQCKGGEFAAHHPRNTLPKYHGYWLGFTYITGNRGGCHLEGSQPWRRYALKMEGADPWPWRSQDTKAIIDSMVGCFFFYRSKAFTSALMKDMINALTGWDWKTEDLWITGERIYNLERCYNIREAGIGLVEPLPDTTPTPELIGKYVSLGDVLPLREFTEPLTKGPGAAKKDEFHPVIDWAAFKRELEEYYELRGWDKKTGRPTRAKLEELGLADVAQELEKLGLLP